MVYVLIVGEYEDEYIDLVSFSLDSIIARMAELIESDIFISRVELWNGQGNYKKGEWISSYSNKEMQGYYSNDYMLKKIEDEIIRDTGFEPFIHSDISKAMGVI